ncbi:hypothetical protein, variant [Exophiala mesophila]|uniref:Calpain catalytic domain-containing protein n=1 Tax=Exophiala mesophila TaxID=212818 RepID=A0A0D1WMC7_EXOME|nr:hypothetical protein, variant [Exophiala mesophila]KIV90165.1 hypothetical protein, variant [Exophiala mesophila]
MNDNRSEHGPARHPTLPSDVCVPAASRIHRQSRRQAPQDTVDQYWSRLKPRFPGKVFTVLPNDPYARRKAENTPHGAVSGQRAAKSYEAAKLECERDVGRIVKECRRLNQKYRDLHFDIEWDLKSGQRNCLDGLSTPGDGMRPKGVKRVTDIFENPQFYINGPTAGDVRQGRDGDCYLMAALCGLGNMKGLINRVCIKQDQQVGVYGFVFFRDGEWQHCIIDDKLYLKHPDWWESQDERRPWDDPNHLDREEEYRKAHQTGSRALYFAQCSDENETWLPLLEKAYAKAHGDYASIDGGFTGEAIEDLTGGVTTELYGTDILDREAFWTNELMQVGKQFLFGCATGFYSNWLDTSNAPKERDGISEGHAYSIMDVREVDGKRLLKLRNPWGRPVKTGAWSDGSSEWTPEWIQKLGHKFGNDGEFWISYEDLLRKYQHFDRTRIFGSDWNVTQCWTAVDVAWPAQYHSTKFSLILEKRAHVVIVLAQLDETYIGGLEGAYSYDLHFRLESSEKEDDNDYIVRSNGNYAMARSVSTDVELEAGTYFVLMKITAKREHNRDHLENVLPIYAATKREKLIQMGLSYDLAHAKGLIVESEEERQERKAHQRIQRAKAREQRKEKARKKAWKRWSRERDKHLREMQRQRKKQQAETMARTRDLPAVGSLERDVAFETRTSSNYALRRIALKNTHEHHVDDLEERQGPISESSMPWIPHLPHRSHVLSENNEVGTSIPRTEAIHISDEDRVTIERESGSTYLTAPQSPVVTLGDVTQESAAATPTQTQWSKTSSSSADQTRGSQLSWEPRRRTEEFVPSPNAGGSGESDDRSLRRESPVHELDTIINLKPLSGPPAQHQPQHVPPQPLPLGQELSHKPDNFEQIREPQREDTLDTTAATQSLEFASTSGPYEDLPTIFNHLRVQVDGEEYDVDSYPPFEWDSVLDMSSEAASSDSEASSRREGSFPGFVHRRHHRRRSGREGVDRRVPLPMHPSPLPGTPNPHFVDYIGGLEEPWNAVCVVGLRVYSTLRDDEVLLKVVRPKLISDEDKVSDKDSNADDVGIERGEANGEDQSNEPLTSLDPDDMARGAVATMH